ncbi:unnamed protein product [Agarophyton chilense]
MEEFEQKGSPLAAVRAFLAQQDVSSSENEEHPEKYIPLPARLGVGANPNQAVHAMITPGLSEASRRLGSALRRQAQAAGNDEAVVESSEGEDTESRARAISTTHVRDQNPQGKEKEAIEKKSHAGGQNQKSERAVDLKSEEKDDSASDDEWGDDVLRRMAGEQDVNFKSWSEGFAEGESTGVESNGYTNGFHGEKKCNIDVGLKRKKKKIRNRQKNVRRDKRK